MKPFNLEEAMAGKPIVTRDGRKAKFIAYVPECDEGWRLLVLLCNRQSVGAFYDSGSNVSIRKTDDDLFMDEEETKPAERFKWGFQAGPERRGSVCRTWPDALTEDEAHKLFLKMPGCINYGKISAPKKEPVVRWLWVDANGAVSSNLMTAQEANDLLLFKMLEWSRTEFPE